MRSWAAILLLLFAALPAQGFSIKIDCSLSEGFCNDPVKHRVLQRAAQVWADLIINDFPKIDAGQTLRFTDYYTKEPFSLKLASPIDDLLIVVRFVEMGGSERASTSVRKGGLPVSVWGKRFRQLPFRPYVGVVTFNKRYKNHWFDLSPETSTDKPRGSLDVFEIFMHEIGHVLGMNVSYIIVKQRLKNGQFHGPVSTAWNDGQPLPMEKSHVTPAVRRGLSKDQRYLMQIGPGTRRRFPGELERAFLSDLGYRFRPVPR